MATDERKPDANADEEQPTTQTSTETTAAGAGVVLATNGAERRPRRRGFAAMDRDRVKAIASKGGRAAHAAGTAHQFNSDEARVAGKKGGIAPHVRRGGVRRRPTSEKITQAPNPTQGHQGDGR